MTVITVVEKAEVYLCRRNTMAQGKGRRRLLYTVQGDGEEVETLRRQSDQDT